MLVVFSACGGIRTGSSLPVLEDCLTGLTGSSTRAGTGDTEAITREQCKTLTDPRGAVDVSVFSAG